MIITPLPHNFQHFEYYDPESSLDLTSQLPIHPNLSHAIYHKKYLHNDEMDGLRHFSFLRLFVSYLMRYSAGMHCGHTLAF